jgi:hypothetical protein
LLTAVVCASAIPQRDRPETSYNEVDTPVNQAPPVVLGGRFVRPVKAVILVPRRVLHAEWNLHIPAAELVAANSVSIRHDSHPLQDLLCTLLI